MREEAHTPSHRQSRRQPRPARPRHQPPPRWSLRRTPGRCSYGGWAVGCFADEYGNAEDNSHFGTHQYMQLCELMGVDPYIDGDMGSGTVKEMSDWVTYPTRDGDSPMARLRRQNGRDRPWRVPFQGIGNETWVCGSNGSALPHRLQRPGRRVHPTT
ncbi:hypothetical protein AB4Z54_40425, partial [Streptomyces sp. MCAF7]